MDWSMQRRREWSRRAKNAERAWRLDAAARRVASREVTRRLRRAILRHRMRAERKRHWKAARRLGETCSPRAIIEWDGEGGAA